MIRFRKTLVESGTVMCGDVEVVWSYNKTVDVVFHEKTETFSAPHTELGRERMCFHDLKVKLRSRYRRAAVAEARRKFVGRLTAAQRHSESKSENDVALPQV